MKKIIIILFIFFSVSVFGQSLDPHAPDYDRSLSSDPNWEQFTRVEEEIEVTKTRTAVNNAGDYLHAIANEFAQEVGKTLKENYPAKINNIDIDFEYSDGKYTLTYTAWLKKCLPEEHQYYFDHRGSMSTLSSKEGSLRDATARCQGQVNPALQSFQKAFGNGELWNYYTYQPFLAEGGRYTSLVEAFIFAKKKK